MKNLFLSLITVIAAIASISAQTAALTPTSLEVIGASGVTRAFYDLDEVYLKYKTGVVTIYEAATGVQLFTGDTTAFSATGASHWVAKAAKLTQWFQNCTKTDGYSYWIPKRGVQLVYKTSDTSVKLVHGVTKKLLLATALDSVKISGVTTVTNILAYLRAQYFQEAARDAMTLPNTATIAADTSAGSSPTIAITGNGVAGLITLTTGTTAIATGNVFTVTLPVTYPTGTFVTLTAADSDAAVHVARVYTEGAAGAFTVKAAGTALADATQYKWFYRVNGY